MGSVFQYKSILNYIDPNIYLSNHLRRVRPQIQSLLLCGHMCANEEVCGVMYLCVTKMNYVKHRLCVSRIVIYRDLLVLS